MAVRPSLALRVAAALCVCALAARASPAAAYGPSGHRIVGLVAEPLLCAAARAEVDALADGERLPDIGLWADNIRRDERWAHSAPWHYMNVADGASLASYRSPREGDVLSAIERFSRELRDAGRPRASRLVALRFLVHFVADVHQPLHVGREEDRGGNRVEVRYGRTEVNLHRFWDTDVIRRSGLSDAAYARELAALVRAARGEPPGTPRDWAAESLALRETVYSFDARSRVLDRAYLERADQVTRRRLAQAGVRLAHTLNALWCDGA
ncbi:MAG TPA: S1/P1 nuclease [Gammaproteobacteria bacterium]